MEAGAPKAFEGVFAVMARGGTKTLGLSIPLTLPSQGDVKCRLDRKVVKVST
jgi:hypothetical protein